MASVPHSNPLLALGFAPLRRELDCADLTVEGELPPLLQGVHYRIGPNPQFEPLTPYNPLMGDGMVHAFRIERGRVSYRNRWVRTGRWRAENAAGRALFATAGPPSDDDPAAGPRPSDGVANTAMVWHAGRLLALEEGSPPIELDPDTLETRGRFDFAGRLPRNMTAHPKIDPVSGRMVFFANVPRGRLTGELVLYEADAAGELAWSCVVQGPYPALVHDFAITERFAILWICPLTLSEERAMSGRPLIAWEPDREVEIIVVPRGGRDEDALRFRGPACMAWHVMNAFDEGERIVLDLCEQAGAMLPSVDGTAPDPARAAQRLSRWELDLSRPGPVSRRALTDLICEYPRIDERRTGRPYRYGYVACLGGPGTGDLFHRGLARFDHETGEMAVWAADPGVAVGEPVFAPRPGGAEEEGWILSTLYDENTDRSCLAVFPAERLPAGPIARVRLDHRVPVGFHGLWRLFDA